jgi:ligand-binding SRPBCC domain-containing protein
MDPSSLLAKTVSQALRPFRAWAGPLQVFEVSQWVPGELDQVFKFFSIAENLERITPSFLRFKILSVEHPSGAKNMSAGTLIDYTLQVHGVPLHWKTRIDEWMPPEARTASSKSPRSASFVDLQILGPYSLWHHRHEFSESHQNGVPGVQLHDRVQFRLPMGVLGQGVAGGFVRKDVEAIFRYRQEVVAALFPVPK